MNTCMHGCCEEFVLDGISNRLATMGQFLQDIQIFTDWIKLNIYALWSAGLAKIAEVVAPKSETSDGFLFFFLSCQHTC